MINIKYISKILIVTLLFTSCKKDWLEFKPDSRLSVLTTVEEYAQLMDNSALYVSNAILLFGTDEFYIPDRNLNSKSAQDISYYTWAQAGFMSTTDGFWTNSYFNIFTSNTTIAGLNKIEKKPANGKLWNETYGSAFFYRALHHFSLSQLFMKAYNHKTASSDLGIPLRLEADVSQKVSRGSVQKVYDQIISDLHTANKFLPDRFSGYKTRPSKNAVYGYLSRIYMAMENYEQAKLYADSALAINNELLDYNSVTSTSALGFNSHSFVTNSEVFFTESQFFGGSLPDINTARVDPLLYASYEANDLRKTIFFRLRETNAYSFKGTYQGSGQSSGTFFMAPANDEMYLNRAECLARAGSFAQAMDELNTLLKKRWKTNTYVPFTAADADDALRIILRERKKELLFRGVRWSDLRRLNKDPRFATTITRIYLSKEYILPPGSNLYTWPLPNDEIQLGGYVQNPR